jgi:hypothetical protein
MNKPKTFPKTHRRAPLKSKRRRSQLLTLAGRVCSIQLRPSRSVRVVLLRLRRETRYGSWTWQLLACRGLDGSDLADTNLHFEGTPT